MRSIVGVAVVLLVLAPPSAGASRVASALERDTLGRPHDPVIVRTGNLEGVPDRHTARWRLYAARAGGLEPIPFQFDPRGTDGEFVLTADGAETDFVFDADDELVFMARDAGDRVAASALPAGADAALEIAIGEPGSSGRGWAYLVRFPGEVPPRSPVRYATFDAARQEARALGYHVHYSLERSNFLDTVRVTPAAGGTGESLFGPLRMRIVPTFSLLVSTFDLSLTEESFSVVPDGMRNGAVRSVRRVRQALDLGPLFPEIPNGRVYTYYYATSFRTPSRFSVPWLVLKALRDFRFESVGAIASDPGEARYWDAANPEGVPFTAGGRPAGTDGDHDWWVMSSERGTFLHALVIPDEWRSWGISRGIVFADEGSADAGDRRGPGAGYSLKRMTNLRRAGAYDLDSVMVVLPGPYRPGDERDALASLHDPLETEVRSLEIGGDGSRRASAER